jgi:hypothetical protein
LGPKLPPIDPKALSKTPWVLCTIAVLVGLALSWFGSIISAFRHDQGLSARDRFVALLGNGNFDWALAVLLAVALLALASSEADRRSPLTALVYQVAFLASAAVAAATALAAIVQLTTVGQYPDSAISGFLTSLAACPIAAAAALWAWRSRPSGPPSYKP